MFPAEDDSRGYFGNGFRYDHESEEDHILGQSSIFASMAMPERSRSPSSDKSYERAIAAALEGDPLDLGDSLGDQQGNADDILGHSGVVGPSTPVSKPAPKFAAKKQL